MQITVVFIQMLRNCLPTVTIITSIVVGFVLVIKGDKRILEAVLTKLHYNTWSQWDQDDRNVIRQWRN